MADNSAAAPPATATQPPYGASPPPPADTHTADDAPLSVAVVQADAFAPSEEAGDEGARGDAEDDGINTPGAGKRVTPAPPSKRPRKKSGNSVWTKPASRKGKKKTRQPAQLPAGADGSRLLKASFGGDDEEFFLTPAPRLAAERDDDAPDLPVLLSRVFKSERIEVSDDRLTAGSTKGFRMIRATRGVAAGAWYFEVKVAHLGASGHTRLGWATNSADLQAPVGADDFGFGYRDIDGSKVHKAWRHEYADQGYGEGEVLGFYISLPDGEQYEPKQPELLHYKGMPFRVEVVKNEQKMPEPVPGSEICFFKNGVCQGTAFADIPGGRYFPAASLYTLNDPKCEVRFNFGPDFQFFPDHFGGRPAPHPMSEVPFKAYELMNNNEGPSEDDGMAEKADMYSEITEEYDGYTSADNDLERLEDYDGDVSSHNDSETTDDYESDEEYDGEDSGACEKTSQEKVSNYIDKGLP